MPKHKTRKRSKTKKRGGRRVGALSMNKDQDLLMLAGGAIVGGIAKKFIDTALAKQETLTVDQKTIDGIELVGGGVIFWMVDQPFLRGMGLGLTAAASVSLLQEMEVLKGMSASPMVPFKARPQLNGVTKTPAVAGANAYGYPRPNAVGAGAFSRRAVGAH